MPAIKETPKTLQPYVCHGLDLKWKDGDDQALAKCPFCSKEGKFSVEIETGKWRCWVCGTGNAKGGGNAYTFLRELWKLGNDRTNGEVNGLAQSRKYMYAETLIAWELVQSPLTGQWLVPGYGLKGEINNLYRYAPGDKPGSMVLKSTWNIPHAIHGLNLMDRDHQEVYICEGPWDAAALWEIMRACKPDGTGGYMMSGEQSSLLKDASVLAVPGANTWHDSWSSLVAGKDVVICFDSDHPRIDGNKTKDGSGIAGTRRLAGILSSSTAPPNSIRYVKWGPEGYAPELKSGWDVRDEVSRLGMNIGDRMKALKGLLDRIEDVPAEWILSPGAKSEAEKTINPQECRSWRDLINVWRKALLWTENLEYILACSMASCVSTDLPGEQLWFLIISPPASGKTTLAEALGVSKKYVLQKDTLTGLYSGFQTDVEGKEDLSLILQMKGKTLIIKDGDTFLKNPNKDQILSQLRALYDRAIRTSFKNKMSRNYERINTTVHINGTDSLRDLDESELGQRFLYIVMMKEINEDLETDIIDRMINNMCDESTEHHDPEKYKEVAMAMTGGYLEYLRGIAPEVWSEIEVSQHVREELRDLALFVAFMRARPGGADGQRSGREQGGRLAVQLTRLAKCLCIVKNKTEVDDEVMAYVRRCAMDSSSGESIKICESLYSKKDQGSVVKQIAIDAVTTEAKVRAHLLFLRNIKVVEQFKWKDPKGKGLTGGEQTKYRLTPRIRELYERVVGDGD